MEALFISLTRALAGTPAIALAAALAWGVLSVVLSPCHLASIPLIVAFVDGQGRIATRRAFLLSTLFAAGILLTIAGIGLVTALAGRMLGDIGVWGNWLIAALFFLVGLHLLDLLPAPWTAPGGIGIVRKGALAAFLLGLLFGLALGPCTFAFMAPVLGLVFGLAADNLLYAGALLAAYAAGHCAILVLAGTFTGILQRYLDWNERSRGALLLRKTCGVLVMAGGAWLLHAAP